MLISQCRDPLERGRHDCEGGPARVFGASTSAQGLPFGGRSTSVGGLMLLARADTDKDGAGMAAHHATSSGKGIRYKFLRGVAAGLRREGAGHAPSSAIFTA
jgi:hypothetical protein